MSDIPIEEEECVIEEFFPVRCRTCGKVISQYEKEYKKSIREGKDPKEILDKFEIKRSCCRAEMLCPQKISMAPRINLENTQREIKPEIKTKEKAKSILDRVSMLAQGKRSAISGGQQIVESKQRGTTYYAV
jgi:DNA-directed RNA polymerase subunit N (RpoN/RPB10)